MKRIHIVGRKNHGKTTLIVDLIGELSRRGIRAGVIKHSSHAHELDTPGKDSYRQRKAGAKPVAVITEDLIGIYMPRPKHDDFYDQMAPMFSACDLILVEGHIDGAGKKIEVWRQHIGSPCLASRRDDIVAVVSDDRPNVDVPVWSREDIAQLAQNVLAQTGIS